MIAFKKKLKCKIKALKRAKEERERQKMQRREEEEGEEGTEPSTSGAFSTQQAGSSASHGALLSDAHSHLQQDDHVTKPSVDQWVQSGMPDQWSTQPAAPNLGPGTKG